jgi:putative transposase
VTGFLYPTPVGRKNSIRVECGTVGDHSAVLDWVSLFVGTGLVGLRSRQALVVENVLLRQQLAVALRTRRRPCVRWHDRLFWVVARRLVTDWRRHLVLVQPETVLRWHRRGWRLFWWWRSRRPSGRPRVPQEVRTLIRRLSEENRLWGTERIRGELLKLGIAVSNGSIRRYRWRPPDRPPSQTWRTFLRNHAPQIWAADLFTVPTLTFRALFVLFFITHDRRELIHVRVTAHPTAAWVWRQLIEATAWGRQPMYMLRDRDSVYGRDFVSKAQRLGIETLLSPFRSPKANAIAERVIRTLRQECLDHVLVISERHLAAVLREYVAFSNTERPHRSLALEPPLRRGPVSSGPTLPPSRVVARPVLGGLHHVYQRAA